MAKTVIYWFLQTVSKNLLKIELEQKSTEKYSQQAKFILHL